MPAPATRTARIEVFRPGTFTPMQGEAITYSAADLQALAQSYDPDAAPAPIVVGHPKTDAPAFGWVTGFDYDADSERLYATIGEIDPAFSEAVKAGRYKKVSLSFFRPDSAFNPVPGTWYPKHVGFLGGAAPAVTGLKNVAFSGADTDALTFSVSFGERGFEEAASLFRNIRDFFIEKFGMEEADKALPGYRIEWLDNMTIDLPSRASFAVPIMPPIVKEPPVPTPPVIKPVDPAFAAQEANLSAREQALNKREHDIAHSDNVAFAEGLVTEGKLIAASKDRLVMLLDAVPVETSVSFSEGQAAISFSSALRELLNAQPTVVSFGREDIPAGGIDTGSASFSADGKQVDQDQLVSHEKALAYQRQNPGTEYLAAVRAVS